MYSSAGFLFFFASTFFQDFFFISFLEYPGNASLSSVPITSHSKIAITQKNNARDKRHKQTKYVKDFIIQRSAQLRSGGVEFAFRIRNASIGLSQPGWSFTPTSSPAITFPLGAGK
ncbi:hypothetical protein AVEN_84787-1 [Araneus ventricosus]|uniref:Uncharacterized protein n=1 Tax=Araneus ventricosus TaxID=182803 RepID=A0A4Y2MYK3_ARAVE|nr:hypothetical protein AVEN_84787-1 [Araneus ventricosus]